MEDAIYALVREHRSLEQGIGSLVRFKAALKALHVELTNAGDVAYANDMHYEVLNKVKTFIKLRHMGDATLKTLHDSVFVKQLGMNGQAAGICVTRLFEEFIKGVTYFRHQIDASSRAPIYHRLYACGPGDQIYRDDHLICRDGLSGVEKKRRRALIERCYLERLIYDALFCRETLHFPTSCMNTEHSQDTGHMFRIDLTRQDYESCFRGWGVSVEVDYEDGRLPVKLTILRKKNGTMVSKEEYKHELRAQVSVIAPYTGVVECSKTLANGAVYGKVQDFTMESDWKRVV